MTVPINARGVTKTYRDGERRTEVLRGVDLEVAPGEFVAILGPSGSGKSTLLHLLGGLDRPDDGAIDVAGQRLNDLSISDLAVFRNRTVGFVFQFHELLPDFTALENIMLPGRIAGLDPAEVGRRAEARLSEVGLEHRSGYVPSELSGGERQRVALARALLLEPPLLLADEPTGNLDPENGRRIMDLLAEFQERLGTTAVLVTHNRRVAARCGRLMELAEGVLRPRTT